MGLRPQQALDAIADFDAFSSVWTCAARFRTPPH